MNSGDVAERLIRAAEIEQVGARVGPAPLRAQQLPYAHTEEDMRNWGHRRGDRRSRALVINACRLLPEDADAHALYRREFWEKLGVTAKDVSEAEEAWSWYALVEDDRSRAALSAWVRCMANHKRLFFKDWCAEQGIHPETGRRRKDRALACILFNLSRKALLHNENDGFGVLPEAPENGYIDDNIAGRVREEKGITSWAADDAFTSFLSDDPADFSWAQKRNEMRRRREARKKTEAA